MHTKKLKSVDWENAECWDLSKVLSEVILLGLQKFKAMKRCGYPANFVTGNEEKDVQAWEDTIDKMIWSFNEVYNDNMNQPLIDDNDVDQYSVAIVEYFARLQEGLELFGKYYNDLWD